MNVLSSPANTTNRLFMSQRQRQKFKTSRPSLGGVWENQPNTANKAEDLDKTPLNILKTKEVAAIYEDR